MPDESKLAQHSELTPEEEPFKLNDLVIQMMHTEDHEQLKDLIRQAREEGLVEQVLQDIPDEIITKEKRHDLERLLRNAEIRDGYKDGYVGGSAEQTANDFEGVFHDVSIPVKALALETLPAGCTVLDIGGGNGDGDVVNYLKEHGHNAVGIDLGAGQEFGQKPEFVASSMHLPFPDKSMDVITSHWGGLNYPLLYLRSETNHQEYVKSIVVAHLKQLSEAIRVAKSEVRISPWGISGFIDAAGLLAIRMEDYDYIFPAINYAKLFDDMNIHHTTISTTRSNMLESAPWQNISLDTRNADMNPLYKLIKTIEESPNDITIKLKGFLPHNEEFVNAFRGLASANGRYYRGVTNHESALIALETGDPKFLEDILNAYDPDDNFKKTLKRDGLAAAVAAIEELNKLWLEETLAGVTAASLHFSDVAERTLKGRMLN